MTETDNTCCYICNSNNLNSSDKQASPKETLPRLTEIFTRLVLKFGVSPKSLKSTTSTIKSQSQNLQSLRFCSTCQKQLSLLYQMETRIHNLEKRCNNLKENLLSSTLSSIISEQLCEIVEKDDKCYNSSKNIGQIAVKIAKRVSMGFRIYKKWRPKFHKLLRTHLNELNIQNQSMKKSNTTRDSFSFDYDDSLDDDYEHKTKNQLNLTNNLDLNESTQPQKNKKNYVQIDHSYFSSTVLVNSKIKNSVSKKMTNPKQQQQQTSTSLIKFTQKRRRQSKNVKTNRLILSSEIQTENNKSTKKDNQMPPASSQRSSFDHSGLLKQSSEPEGGNQSKESQSLVDNFQPDQNNQVIQIINAQSQSTTETPETLDQEYQQTQNPKQVFEAPSSKCQTCSEIFCNEDELQLHSSSHNSESEPSKAKIFQCELEKCGKIFHSKKQLAIHRKIHGGEKRYLCDTCGSLFLSLPSLHSHRKTHLGLKPHVCQVCQRSFRSAGHLSTHKLIHSGEKPFSCSICDKLFNRKENLRVHEFTHATVKPYKCTTCANVSFTRPILLRKHLLEKHSSSESSSKVVSVVGKKRKSVNSIYKTQIHPQTRLPLKYDAPTTILLHYSPEDIRQSFTTIASPTASPDDEISMNLETHQMSNETNFVQQAFLLTDGQYLILQS